MEEGILEMRPYVSEAGDTVIALANIWVPAETSGFKEWYKAFEPGVLYRASDGQQFALPLDTFKTIYPRVKI